MYKKELERVSPESVGLDSGKIIEMISKLESCGTEMHGFMLSRYGKVAAECWWEPYHADLVHICHSMGKSYTATAVGLACTDNLLKVDDLIVDLFKEEIGEYGIRISEGLKKITVKHVLTMTNGMSIHPMTGEEFVKNYLLSVVDIEPGTEFMYNTAGSCLLGAIVRKVTGMGIKEYLFPRIFHKIGIETEKMGWIKFKNGIEAAPGVSSTTENNLRLGLLYMNYGEWNGEQLIDRNWIEDATRKQIGTESIGDSPDSTSGYGYQLWMGRTPGVFRFDGGHGQIVVADRKSGFVISINQGGSLPGDTDRVADILHEYIFGAGHPDSLPENKNMLTELQTFSSLRQIPAAVVGKSSPVPESIYELRGIYNLIEGEFHIYPELRVLRNQNVNEDFYVGNDFWAKNISIDFLTKDLCELVIDDKVVLKIPLDGRLFTGKTWCEIPGYNDIFVRGEIDNNNTLHVITRYYQTCFDTHLWFTINDGVLEISVTKKTLHDESPEFTYHAKAERVVSSVK